jgi:hypothetical protein
MAAELGVEVSPTLYWLAAVLVAVVGTARLTRLLVFDTYPPAAWVRARWDGLTKDGPWSVLVHCGYCAAPWIAVVTIAWGYFTDLHWSWWVFYGWLALSYLAATFVSWDEPVGPDD